MTNNTMTKNTEFTKDLANKKIHVVREFSAPVAKVWRAWTDSSILDQWWAPKPWKAETKTHDFRVGGMWLYCMVGPDGTRAWCRADYRSITPQERFTGIDAFCDEQGNPDRSFPSMNWDVAFKPTSSGTTVEVTITYSSEADMQKILEMGFEEGFTMALGNLDELLEA